VPQLVVDGAADNFPDNLFIEELSIYQDNQEAGKGAYIIIAGDKITIPLDQSPQRNIDVFSSALGDLIPQMSKWR
jgi:hypothetical protein